MVTSETISKIAPALVQAQKNMTLAVKDTVNPFFKRNFADLNAIREAVIPALNEAKVMVLQPTVTVDNRNFVRTMLLHESGEFLSSDTEVVVGKQNDPQALGSAISYARRYGLQSMMCVGSVDDDGEANLKRDNKGVVAGPATAPVKQEAVATAKTSKEPASFAPLKKPAPKAPPAASEAAVENDGWE